jgi:hypothetical protein
VPCGRLKAASLDPHFQLQLNNHQSSLAVADAIGHHRIQMMNQFLSKEVERDNHRDPYQLLGYVNIVDLESDLPGYQLLSEVQVLRLDKCRCNREEP